MIDNLIIAISSGIVWVILTGFCIIVNEDVKEINRRLRRLEEYVEMPKNQPFPGEY